jgi:putative colanic acid biosynthesis UDP-glucose lipid carrier transferase
METVPFLADGGKPAFLESSLFHRQEAQPGSLPAGHPAAIHDIPGGFAFSLSLHKTRNALLKRAIDLLVSTLLIVLVFPWFLPLMGIVIKLDSKGPVFFRQRRGKKGRRLFTCLKLRTMVVNEHADTLAACENDPRITRVGAFLRRTHLDELPQVFNVWMGDMSLIGPRPHMVSDNQHFEPIIADYAIRHYVKPGITGLAQVRGYVGPVPDAEAMKARVAQDIHYISEWSAGLDIRIICSTLLKMVGNK